MSNPTDLEFDDLTDLTTLPAANAKLYVMDGNESTPSAKNKRLDLSVINSALATKAASDHNHNSDYAPIIHNHDSRYYTETEMDTLLNAKQASGSYAAASHDHDGRYYTESEIDTLLNAKQNSLATKRLVPDGTVGQTISYDASNEPVAVDAASGGGSGAFSIFNGF